MRPTNFHWPVIVAPLLVLGILAACEEEAPAAPSVAAGPAPTLVASPQATAEASPAPTATPVALKIALLLPDSTLARYDAKDRPVFESKIKSLCADCVVLYSNANQDASLQRAQADAAIAGGASALVIDPVNRDAAAEIADRAKAQKVPVVSYDQLINGSDGVDCYVSYDPEEAGRLQGSALLDSLGGGANPAVVMIDGPAGDAAATLLKQGAHSVLDGKVAVAKEYDTAGFDPDAAQGEMSQALAALNNKVDGVYAATDGLAGGAIAALKTAGVKPPRPVTGRGAELAAIQRIVAGDQYMTVYQPIQPQAEAAATVALTLARAASDGPAAAQGKVTNNGKKDVPSVLLRPVAVTRGSIASTVIADGYWDKDQICTPVFADACAAAGLN